MERYPLTIQDDWVQEVDPATTPLVAVSDMFANTYDPHSHHTDVFNRQSHTGVQPAGVLTGIGNAAFCSVGTAPNTVAASDHVHPCCGGDMLASIYDPTDVRADVFARTYHHGTQLLVSIVDAGDAASKDLGDTATTVARGDHTHPSGYLLASVCNPTNVRGSMYSRSNHHGVQPASTVTGWGNAATKEPGTSATQVSRGAHSHSEVSGFVSPSMHAHRTYTTTGWQDPANIPFVLSPGNIPIVGATPGIIPCPPEPTFMFFGDGTWKNPLVQIIQENVTFSPEFLPSMQFATSSVSGEAGVVPAPPATVESKVLSGGGWAPIHELITEVSRTALPLVTNGNAGRIPAPTSSEITHVFTSNMVWATLSDALSSWAPPLDKFPVYGVLSGIAPNSGSTTNVLFGSGWCPPIQFLDTLPINTELLTAFQGNANGPPKAGIVPAPPAGHGNALLMSSGMWNISGAGLTWRGPIVEGTAYVQDELVGYAGGTYVARRLTYGSPATDPVNWSKCVDPGADRPNGVMLGEVDRPSDNWVAQLEAFTDLINARTDLFTCATASIFEDARPPAQQCTGWVPPAPRTSSPLTPLRLRYLAVKYTTVVGPTSGIEIAVKTVPKTDVGDLRITVKQGSTTFTITKPLVDTAETLRYVYLRFPVVVTGEISVVITSESPDTYIGVQSTGASMVVDHDHTHTYPSDGWRQYEAAPAITPWPSTYTITGRRVATPSVSKLWYSLTLCSPRDPTDTTLLEMRTNSVTWTPVMLDNKKHRLNMWNYVGEVSVPAGTNVQYRLGLSESTLHHMRYGSTAPRNTDVAWLRGKPTIVGSNIRLLNLPTSANNLTSGQLWKDSLGLLRVVP